MTVCQRGNAVWHLVPGRTRKVCCRKPQTVEYGKSETSSTLVVRRRQQTKHRSKSVISDERIRFNWTFDWSSTESPLVRKCRPVPHLPFADLPGNWRTDWDICKIWDKIHVLLFWRGGTPPRSTHRGTSHNGRTLSPPFAVGDPIQWKKIGFSGNQLNWNTAHTLLRCGLMEREMAEAVLERHIPYSWCIFCQSTNRLLMRWNATAHLRKYHQVRTGQGGGGPFTNALGCPGRPRPITSACPVCVWLLGAVSLLLNQSW